MRFIPFLRRIRSFPTLFFAFLSSVLPLIMYSSSHLKKESPKSLSLNLWLKNLKAYMFCADWETRAETGFPSFIRSMSPFIPGPPLRPSEGRPAVILWLFIDLSPAEAAASWESFLMGLGFTPEAAISFICFLKLSGSVMALPLRLQTESLYLMYFFSSNV